MARITMEVIQHYNVLQNFLPDLGEMAPRPYLPEEEERKEPWFHAVTESDGLYQNFGWENFGISFVETEISGTPGEALTYRYYPSGDLAVTGFGPQPESVLVLREGSRYYSDATDPYGFTLVYDTKRLEVEQRDGGARIHLEYNVEGAGQVLEHNEVTIEACE